MVSVENSGEGERRVMLVWIRKVIAQANNHDNYAHHIEKNTQGILEKASYIRIKFAELV